MKRLLATVMRSVHGAFAGQKKHSLRRKQERSGQRARQEPDRGRSLPTLEILEERTPPGSLFPLLPWMSPELAMLLNRSGLSLPIADNASGLAGVPRTQSLTLVNREPSSVKAATQSPSADSASRRQAVAGDDGQMPRRRIWASSRSSLMSTTVPLRTSTLGKMTTKVEAIPPSIPWMRSQSPTPRTHRLPVDSLAPPPPTPAPKSQQSRKPQEMIFFWPPISPCRTHSAPSRRHLTTPRSQTGRRRRR